MTGKTSTIAMLRRLGTARGGCEDARMEEASNAQPKGKFLGARRRCLVARRCPQQTHAGTRDRCHRTVLCGSRLITAASLVPLRASAVPLDFANSSTNRRKNRSKSWLRRVPARLTATQTLRCWAAASPSDSAAELLSALVPGETGIRNNCAPPPHLNEWGSADPPGESRRRPGVWRQRLRTDALCCPSWSLKRGVCRRNFCPGDDDIFMAMLADPPMAAALAHTVLGYLQCN